MVLIPPPRIGAELPPEPFYFKGSLCFEPQDEPKMVRRVLQAMLRQAAWDGEAEDAKAMFGPAPGCGLADLFRVLDPTKKGYIVETDLLQLMKEHEQVLPLANLCAVVEEAELKRGKPVCGHLSFRDLGKMIFPITSKEYKAMSDASSDDEARSLLYLLHFSEPCPQCGFRIQRDSDATRCPTVVCSKCQTAFRCFVVGQPGLEGLGARAAERFTLCRLVSEAARAAESLQQDRRSLAAEPGFDQSSLREAFDYIAQGRDSFDTLDLRQAFRDQHVQVAEKELDLLWQRYAPAFGKGVHLEHFAAQLRYDPMWTEETCAATERLLTAVLKTMLRQGATDLRAEEGKALAPKGCPLVTLFQCLDGGKGYILDLDFWQLQQDFGQETSFDSLCTLVQEVQLRRRRDATPGRLSLRDFGVLLCSEGSQELEALQCGCDLEARTRLYLLQHAERCPHCGVHVQRDADAATCPEVSCPLCRSSFRCTRLACGPEVRGLSVPARQQLCRALAAAAAAALELERDRHRLAQLLGDNATVLSDVFGFLSQGRQGFTLPDLRRALTHLHLRPVERELKLLWSRYAAGSPTVSFRDFCRQLRPLSKGGPL